MTLDQFTTFLGWWTAIDVVLLLFAAVVVISLRGLIMRLHSRLLGIAESELPRLYFHWLAQFKVMVIVFNLVPWLALKAMGQ